MGGPFNIASYALLTHLIAHCLGYGVGEFVWSIGDCHLYQNHLEQAKLQLTRDPKPFPTVKLNLNKTNLFEFKFEDIKLVNYDSHPRIKAKVSV